MRLHQSSQTHLAKKNDHFEISVYASDELTKEGLIQAFNRLKSSFPNLDTGFHQVFSERIKEKGIGDQRLMDSINHVIDNCVYPTPTIANFLSFDQNIKLYTYDQMCKKNNELQGIFKLFQSVKIEGISHPLWASNQDVEKYNLTKFKADEK